MTLEGEMTIRKYARGLSHATGLIWLTAFIVSLPASLALHLIVPAATAGQVAVVVAAPLALFFLYIHLAVWILQVNPAPQKAQASSPTIAFVVKAIMLMMLTLPSAFVYWFAGIDWAMEFALLLSVAWAVGILCATLVRWFTGGARDFARVALIPAAVLTATTATAISVSSAVTTVRTVAHRVH